MFGNEYFGILEGRVSHIPAESQVRRVIPHLYLYAASCSAYSHERSSDFHFIQNKLLL